MALIAAGLLCCSLYVTAQKLDGYGTSGGSGPTGGIGDQSQPVLRAYSFITDGMVASSSKSTRQLTRGRAPVLQTNGTYGIYKRNPRRKVVVDSTSAGAQQEMLGFGHAWTDSTVEVFNKLEPSLLDQLMEELFGQDGNNMGFMRHTIGSSDLSGTQYSYDDNGASYDTKGKPDNRLSSFTLGDSGNDMARLLGKMGDYKGDVFLYSAPWSYPGWMKQSEMFVTPDDTTWANNTLNHNYIPQAIDYLSQYVDAFQSEGVIINGLSLQNEPLEFKGGYPTMLMEAADASELLNAGLGDAMHQRGVKVIAYDHNTDRPDYPEEVIENAGQYVDSVGWHCYEGPVANYKVLADFNSKHPSTPQFMTECSNTNVKVGSNNFWLAQNFLRSVRYGASGGTFWVLATDEDFGPRASGGCTTCMGQITVTSSSNYEKNIDYYMMGQFSRFIRRGGVNYKILQGQQGTGSDWNSQFFVIAVQNPDGGWAVVFLNSFGQKQDVDLEFTQSGFTWQGSIPASSVVTWLLPADDIASEQGPYGESSSPYGQRKHKHSSHHEEQVYYA